MQVSVGIFLMVAVGIVLGAVAGALLETRIKTLLYEVGPGDMGVVTVPLFVIVLIALLSAIPPIIQGIRTDPVEMLRADEVWL